MNLCIDQGNSRTKVAIFSDENKILKSLSYKRFTSADVERIFSLYPLRNSIVSSVVNIEPSVINALHRRSGKMVLFDHLTPIPITNCYETPETLGQDRLAAAVGAQTLAPDTNLLIIDIGSAITYDFVDQQGNYHGGNIAPGLKMRLAVLNQMTTRLPLIDVDENELIPLFGHNTRDAIKAGVVRGIAFEVKGYMRTLQERVGNFRTFLTGGHAAFIINTVQSNLDYNKNLVLIGLNTILEYNLHKA